MAYIGSYHRPGDLAEALALLARPDTLTFPLGGGTQLNGRPLSAPAEVVDLQDLGLSTIEQAGSRFSLGAMTTLQQLVDHEPLPPVLRELARTSAPSTIRNMATIGGTVASRSWESPLLAGLLAYGATITVAREDGSADYTLDDALQTRDAFQAGIITAIALEASGRATFAGTARTPADTPIVLVVGHQDETGSLRVAATGLASTPIRIDPATMAELDPPGDFRGSPDYRRHLAATLTSRVLNKLAASP